MRENLGKEMCQFYRELGIFAAEEPVRRIVNRIEKLTPEWIHPMHGGSLPKEVVPTARFTVVDPWYGSQRVRRSPRHLGS